MEITSHEPGTPSWVDLGVPDVDKGVAFYGGLFGWDQIDTGEEGGGYRMMTLRGESVAGLGPQQNPGPPVWQTYVTVADADACAARAKELGGMVFVEAFDVLTFGRMAVIADPTGAVFAVWQPKQHIGSELVNESNILCWNELNSRDLEASKAFYTQLFGWGVGGAPEYVEWQVNGRTVGGSLPMPPAVPAEVPPHWLVYFAVDDCDAAVAQVQQLGGALVTGPMEVPVGRFAVVQDDQGAMFAVIRMTT